MRKWTSPPDAVYNAGKKKERATKAIRALEALKFDVSDSINKNETDSVATCIDAILPVLKSYRKLLDS